jgi:Flp pilus assembly pilin Flp
MRHRTFIGRKGQTILEYTVILIVILGAMIVMKDYVKRGIQGRWKSATDDLGDQYDPQSINSNINYSTQVNSQSIITVVNGSYTPPGQPQEQGQWTNRVDYSNSLETKIGFTQVGD